MTRLNIDNIDVYAKYGVVVTNGGYDDLIAFPPLKSIQINNWHEYDGEEADLSAPVLDSREVTINFVAHGTSSGLDAFIALLIDGAYHDFEFCEIGRMYRLRLVLQSNLKIGRRIEQFALRFADDFPLHGYTYEAPWSTTTPRMGCQIDGVELSRYGVYLLDGSREEVAKMATTKKNLLINIESQPGAIYDGEMVRFNTKDMVLNCLMQARTIGEFWRNYDALLYDLTRPNERKLYVASTRCEYSCYYKSCRVTEFYANGKVWLKFEITLISTRKHKYSEIESTK